MVAGLAALYIDAHPDATAEEINQFILNAGNRGRLASLDKDSPDNLLSSASVSDFTPQDTSSAYARGNLLGMSLMLVALLFL